MTSRPPLPRNDAEFDAVISAIDAELQAKGVAIHARSMHAVGKYAERYGLVIPITRTVIEPGVYTGGSAAGRIYVWFDDRYGDRQKVDVDMGSTVIVLRGDPWRLRIPMILGQVTCTVDPDIDMYRDLPTIGREPTLNILTMVVDLPSGLAQSLTWAECVYCMDTFMMAYETFQAIGNTGGPYVREALSDFDASITHLFSHPPHYGQSKWSTAQAAEKVLKNRLVTSGQEPPHTHNIVALVKRLGGDSELRALANQVQASASVRYGEDDVSMEQSVLAYRACIELCSKVAAGKDKNA